MKKNIPTIADPVPEVHASAMCTAYLLRGVDRALSADKDLHARVSSRLSGDLGIVSRVVDFAMVVEIELLREEQRPGENGALGVNWPGVPYYEIVEPLGEWIAERIDTLDVKEVRAEAVRRINELLDREEVKAVVPPTQPQDSMSVTRPAVSGQPAFQTNQPSSVVAASGAKEKAKGAELPTNRFMAFKVALNTNQDRYGHVRNLTWEECSDMSKFPGGRLVDDKGPFTWTHSLMEDVLAKMGQKRSSRGYER